jgi:predicted porin
MNNTIKLAVAAALLAAASSANAGISIPAGDWTLDIGGVVNAYYTSTRVSGSSVNSTGTKTASNITTGLLPNYLTVSGKTRQNDLDVAFTISINPGASTQTSGIQSAQQENRQAFLTFGDASWGSIKLGKDLGIYASDAILNDMTLLGVGHSAGALAGNTTTLGSIGAGYMYADWKSQIAYSSPNWNGFSFTAGITQAFGGYDTNGATAGTPMSRGGAEPAFEGKASYAWTGDVAGKVWVSGISQKVVTALDTSDRAEAWDIGANVNVAGFGATAYYGNGSGTGMTVQMTGFDTAGVARDSEDWYVQGTYTIPGVGTKLGARYGESKIDGTAAAAAAAAQTSREMWAIGAYHPLTKHLNLVAEYADTKNKSTGTEDGKAKTISLGAILFF